MSDCWADWIRTRRTGGDAAYEARMLEELGAVRDKVLDRAALQPGETLLDVGCGNGLIGFGAIERGAGEVVFADVSAPLLDDCRELAAKVGVLERADSSSRRLRTLRVPDNSVDLVTTRSVLIYVKEKERAFREFLRVLRPGGRISLFEPINRFGIEERRRNWGFDLDEDAARLMERLTSLAAEFQPSGDPMFDFDERDLLALAEKAGFFPIELSTWPRSGRSSREAGSRSCTAPRIPRFRRWRRR